MAARIGWFAMVLGTSLVSRAQAQSPLNTRLPPGVTLPQEVPGKTSVPPEVEVHSIEVDWTVPDLKVEVELHGTDGSGAGDWDRVAAGDPSALKIQLAGFEGGGRRGELEHAAGRMGGPRASSGGGSAVILDEAAAGDARFPRTDRALMGGIIPWTLAGPSTRALAGWDGALSSGGAWVGVHWLGTVGMWLDSPPKLDFPERLLLSTLNPVSGQGSFIVVQNRAGGLLDLGRLTEWIEAALPEHHLLAVHSRGGDSYVEQGTWQLQPANRESGVKAAGVVLILRRRGERDLRDIARGDGVQLEASSYEFAYAPDQVISGRLWPVAQRPPIWMSRQSEWREGKTPWLALNFDRSRNVETIRLVHAPGTGWSAHFLPRSLSLVLTGSDDFAEAERIEISPQSPVSTVHFGRPRPLRGIRLEYTEPGEQGIPSAARLMALQVWGQGPGGDRPDEPR